MYCIKCGREIEEDHLFCGSCLEIMKKYPVKPGTAIQIPSRKDSPVLKKTYPKRRQAPSLEEQVRILKKRLTRMVILWLITFALLAAAIYPTVQYFLGRPLPLPGQNYTTIVSTEETEP